MPERSAPSELPEPEPRDEDDPVTRERGVVPPPILLRLAALLEQEQMAGVFPGEPLS